MNATLSPKQRRTTYCPHCGTKQYEKPGPDLICIYCGRVSEKMRWDTVPADANPGNWYE